MNRCQGLPAVVRGSQLDRKNRGGMEVIDGNNGSSDGKLGVQGVLSVAADEGVDPRALLLLGGSKKPAVIRIFQGGQSCSARDVPGNGENRGGDFIAGIAIAVAPLGDIVGVIGISDNDSR